MPNRKLANYLRASRKRAGLSQEDLAFLLGCKSGKKVSRYEMFHREPKLPTVLALEAIFEKPARELFAGAYEQAQAQTRRRAAQLLKDLTRKGIQSGSSRRLAILSRLASGGHELPPV